MVFLTSILLPTWKLYVMVKSEKKICVTKNIRKKIAIAINKRVPYKEMQIKLCATHKKLKKEMTYQEWVSESEWTRQNKNVKRKKKCLSYLRTFTTEKSTRIRKYMQFSSWTPIRKSFSSSTVLMCLRVCVSVCVWRSLCPPVVQVDRFNNCI